MRIVLVAGAQRSGTTMLASLLGNEPGTMVLPDSGLLTKATTLGDAATPVTAQRFDQMLRSVRRISQWPIERAAIHDHDLPSEATLGEMLTSWLTHLSTLLGVAAPTTVISHEPTDLPAVPAIRSLFPDLAMIHLIRDGRAVAASAIRTEWAHASLQDAAEWWSDQVGLGLAATEYLRRAGAETARFHYETLVAEPTATLSQMGQLLGFASDPATWSGGAFLPLSSTNDHALVGGAPRSERADAWRRELSDGEIALIESRVGGMLELLGYPLMSNSDPGTLARLNDARRRRLVGPRRRASRAIRFRARRLRSTRQAAR